MFNQMLECIISSDYGPTHVVQCGLDDLLTTVTGRRQLTIAGKAIIVIPGNPGNVTTFKDLISQLNTRTGLPVFGFSYFGHIASGVAGVRQDSMKVSKQIEHKIALIDSLIPKGVSLVLVGHSIGAYMVLEVMRLLELREASRHDRRIISHSFLLTPAIERLAETANGKRFAELFKERFCLVPIYLTQLLPDRLSELVLSKLVFSNEAYSSNLVPTLLQLNNATVVRNVIALAEDEFRWVKRRDDATISRNAAKLTIVYGREDGWAPFDFYEQVRNVHPDCDVRYEESFRHSFSAFREATDFISKLIAAKLLDKKIVR